MLGKAGDAVGAELSNRFFYLCFFFVLSLFPASRVKSDLLEVGISGHGADRCDQDDEIYLMVQEIWSESAILGVKRYRGRKMRQRADYHTTGLYRGIVNRPCPRDC